MERETEKWCYENYLRIKDNFHKQKDARDRKIIDTINRNQEIEDMYNRTKEMIKDSASKLKNRLFKSRKLKLGILIGTTSLVFGSALYIKSNEEELDVKKAINNLEIEVGTHGGAKDINEDEYLYNLNQHLDSGKCKIKDENLLIEDRISRYCIENNIPNYIEVAAIEKFHYYMSNDYQSANSIDLINIYNTCINNPESKHVKLKNGDIITIDGDNVTYTYNQGESDRLSK